MRYVALLRAVNVGGTGALPMAGLRALCIEVGFERVETYIASGNVVFESEAAPSTAKAALEGRLLAHAGKPICVVMRSAAEIAAVVAGNPFVDVAPKLVHAIFLDAPPPRNALERAVGRNDELLRLGEREIFVCYPNGMGRSRLKIPAAATGTARNMNTVARLAEIAAGR